MTIFTFLFFCLSLTHMKSHCPLIPIQGFHNSQYVSADGTLLHTGYNLPLNEIAFLRCAGNDHILQIPSLEDEDTINGNILSHYSSIKIECKKIMNFDQLKYEYDIPNFRCGDSEPSIYRNITNVYNDAEVQLDSLETDILFINETVSLKCKYIETITFDIKLEQSGQLSILYSNQKLNKTVEQFCRDQFNSCNTADISSELTVKEVRNVAQHDEVEAVCSKTRDTANEKKFYPLTCLSRVFYYKLNNQTFKILNASDIKKICSPPIPEKTPVEPEVEPENEPKTSVDDQTHETSGVYTSSLFIYILVISVVAVNAW